MQTVYKCNMPNHHDWELRDLYQQETVMLRKELQAIRADAARVVQALDCALQLIDCLIAFLPEGMVLPEGVKTCKHRLDEAMDNIRRR
jgi:hypothetical protein